MEKKKSTKKKKNSRMQFFRYLAIALVIISIICVGLIYFINVLPTEYFLVCIALFTIIDFIMCYLLL